MFYYCVGHLAILHVGWLGAQSMKEVDVKRWRHEVEL